MEINKKQFSSILEALRANPRGMNVTEVARVTGMNRATVSKYLEILYVSGHADVRLFGMSKVYYVSQRMPISAFLNFSSDLIVVLDRDSRVLNANDSFFEFTGTRREDVVHKNVNNFDFLLKFDPPIDEHITRALDGNGTTIESYYRKNDRDYYFNVKLIPLVFDDGKKGVTIIFEDITGKKLAEKALLDSNRELESKVRERTLELEKTNEALRKSEERYRKLIEDTQVVVWEIDENYMCTYVSPRSTEALGFEPREVVGKMPPDYIPPDEVSRIVEQLVPIVDARKPFELAYHYVFGKDGRKVYFKTNAVPIFDDGGRFRGYRGVSRDITEGRK